MTKITRIFYLLLMGMFFASQVQAEWVDISPSVEISQTRQAMDRVNRVLFSYVTVKNTSGVTIEAPLRLNIIDPNIPVVNADGLSADFHSYIQINEDLIAGEEKTVRVSFELARGRLSFGVALYSDKPIIQMSGDRFYNPPSSVRNITERLENEGKVFSPYVDGAFVVWFVDGTSLDRVQQISESINASVQGSAGDNEYLLVTSNTNLTLSEMSLLKRQLEEFAEVALVTVNYLSLTGSDANNTAEVSSDSGNKQYYLKEAGIQDAWVELMEIGKTIGGTDKRVGVLDDVLVDDSSDFFGEHPDLNILGLSDECIPNGEADITRCLMAIQSSEKSILNISRDRGNIGNERNESHGTHVTGIIGAEHGNDKGISGIMHKKKIIFVRAGLGAVSSIFSVHTAQNLLIEELDVHILNMSVRTVPTEITAEDGTQYCLFSKGYLSDNETPDLWVQSKKQSKCKDNDFGDNHAFAIRIKDYIDSPDNYEGRFNKNRDVADFQDVQNVYRELALEVTKFYHKADEKWSKVIIIHAAGNENQSAAFNTTGPCGINNNLSLSTPLYTPVTLCVAALKKPTITGGYYEFADFSNYGAQVDIATFGVGIYSTILKYHYPFLNSDLYGYMNGTSQAAPIITGIAGLIWNAYPNLTASQVKEAIINGVSKTGSGDLRNCALSPTDSKQSALHDPTQRPVPVANAYCALKYAENLNQQRPGGSVSPRVTFQLNDTGITWGANYPKGNNSTCTGVAIQAQDCSHGRDATHNDDSDGDAGFSYTKLDAEGHDLPASASTWSCVRDNVTGLVWEKKTNDGGIHDKDNLYRWGGVTALGRDHADKEGIYYDDWNTLVDGSNSHNFCGFNDWRVPNRHELRSIVNLGGGNVTLEGVSVKIDTDYFPNVTDSTYRFPAAVWSSSPAAVRDGGAWYIYFGSGRTSIYATRDSYSVRLVRSGQ